MKEGDSRPPSSESAPMPMPAVDAAENGSGRAAEVGAWSAKQGSSAASTPESSGSSERPPSSTSRFSHRSAMICTPRALDVGGGGGSCPPATPPATPPAPAPEATLPPTGFAIAIAIALDAESVAAEETMASTAPASWQCTTTLFTSDATGGRVLEMPASAERALRSPRNPSKSSSNLQI